MKITARANLLMLFRMVKRFLFVLIIPVIIGIIQFLFYRRIQGALKTELFAAIGVLIFGIIRLLCFKIELTDDTLTVTDGAFVKRVSSMRIDKISSVGLKTGVLFDLFGAASITFDTESGKRYDKDFEFKISKRKAQKIYVYLTSGKPQQETKISNAKTYLLSVTTSSALKGFIIVIPFVKAFDVAFETDFYRVLFFKIQESRSLLLRAIPPGMDLLLVCFALFYTVTFIIALLRNWNMTVRTDRKKAEIQSGLIFRKRRRFRFRSLNNLLVVQTPIMRLFKRYSLNVSVGGYGDKKVERATVAPLYKYSDIIDEFADKLPELLPKGDFIRAKRGGASLRRFLFYPFFITACAVVGFSGLILLFPEFKFSILMFFIISLVFLAFFVFQRVRDYKSSEVLFGEVFSAKGTNKLSFCELFVKKKNIGEIKLTQYPPDVFKNTCKVKIIAKGEKADSQTVRFLDYDAVKCGLYENFDLDGIDL